MTTGLAELATRLGLPPLHLTFGWGKQRQARIQAGDIGAVGAQVGVVGWGWLVLPPLHLPLGWREQRQARIRLGDEPLGLKWAWGWGWHGLPTLHLTVGGVSNDKQG